MTIELKIEEMEQRVRNLETMFGVGPKLQLGTHRLQVKAIQIKICRGFDITMHDLLGTCREQRFVHPRFLAIWLARKITQAPCSHLGLLFHRDHGAISHACRTVEALIATEPNYAAEVRRWLDALNPKQESTKRTIHELAH
jgi:chromosomal replication initiation ATPase DnaA